MTKSFLWKVHFAQIVVQLCGATYYVLTKSSLTAGVNKIVFSVYQKSSAVFVLAIVAGFNHSRGELPRLTARALWLMFLTAFAGIFAGQLLLLAGLAMTSSAFAATMQNAMPAFAFLLAAVFRLEEARFDRRDGLAKVLGVIFCVTGACVMSLYQGFVVIGDVSSGDLQPVTEYKVEGYSAQLLQAMSSQFSLTTWQLGSLCLFGSTLCVAVFINLQAAIVAIYPAPVHMVCIVSFFGVIMLAVTGLLMLEPSDWVVTRIPDLISIFYGGSVTSAFCSALSTWCVQLGGPVIVAAYMPLLAVFSGALGLLMLGDVLYLGSILGALLIFAGLFLVTWGKDEHRRLEAQLSELDVPLPCETGIRERLLVTLDK